MAIPSEDKPKLILCRHAQTEANHKDIVLGQGDSPLTQDGKSMLQSLALHLSRFIRPRELQGRILTSPLGRARTSAEIMAEQIPWPVTVREELKELAAGDWEGLPRSFVLADRHKLRMSWHDHPPSGESYAHAEHRVRRVITDIRQNNKPHLLMGHSVLNRIVAQQWTGCTAVRALLLDFPFGSACIFSENGETRFMDHTGRLQAESLVSYLDQRVSPPG